MMCNVGTNDRIIRAVIGLIVILVGLYNGSWWGLAGLIPLGTAITGFCGLYKPFGISTCKAKK